MKSKFAFSIIYGLTITMGLASCAINLNNSSDNSEKPYVPEDPVITDPLSRFEYDGRYDDLEVSELTPVKSLYTYKDYDDNSYYHSQGYPQGYSPNQGDANYLIIPVWFNDSDTFIKMENRETVRDDIRKAYLGTEEETGWESVKTYYAKDSFGNLNISGVVSDWYEIDKSYTDYFDGNATNALVKSATKWYKETKNGGQPLTDFDCDKDGFLDSVILIYAAPEYYSLIYSGMYGQDADISNLWAYTSWIMDARLKNKYDPGPDTFFWASYDFMYGMNIAGLKTGKFTYGHGETEHVKIDSHTFIHETGHLFGLPDYYNYGGGKSYSLQFSMQDHNMGAHDPYSRFSLGWSKAYVPTETTKFTINTSEEDGNFILLSPQYNGSAFDEYLAIELYSPTRLNELDTTYNYSYYSKGPNATGARMFHVDSRLFSYKTNKVTSNPKDKMIINATTNSDGNRSTDLAGKSEYKQLTGIRKGFRLTSEDGTSTTETRPSYIYNGDLFTTGDYFTMEKYATQFPEGKLLNNGLELGWAIYFDEVNSDSMTVTCIKL